MKKPKWSGKRPYLDGYTIVEVIIFLAVSGVMVLAASLLVSGRIQKNSYTQGVVQLDQKLSDIFNDVSTGYYPSANNFTCTSVAGVPIITPGVGEGQGKNDGCVFVGKMIHFHAEELVSGKKVENNNLVEVATLVASKDTKSMDKVNGDIKVLAYRSDLKTQIPGALDRFNIGAGIELQSKPSASGPWTDFGVVTDTGRSHTLVILSNFNQTAAGEAQSGNAQNVKLYLMNGWKNDVLNEAELTEINDYVYLCLQQDGAGGRKSTLKISKQLTIERIIDWWHPRC